MPEKGTRVFMRILSPNGMPISDMTFYPEEQECVISRGHQFAVASATVEEGWDGGDDFVLVDLIDTDLVRKENENV